MRTPTSLRADFATRMAAAYGREVPAYDLLVEVCAEVNADVLGRDGDAAERLGSVARVTAERHGAIRVGTPDELREVSRIFAALGMYPVGCYDLREAARVSVPVVSTAFRPVAPDELAANPFRMFTSLLVTDDRRFFDADLQARLEVFLAARTLFPAELLELAEQAIGGTGLPDDDAERFLKLATEAFALSDEPVDAAWYAELEAVSAVAADIGGVTSTHINHLTPRVLDIDELYQRMTARGVRMIDTIQGPPRADGAAVLLRQTSFRALAEERLFRTESGELVPGSLRVRFGEVEARGIALTAAGRDRYDAGEALPTAELELLRHGLAFFTFTALGPIDPSLPLVELVESGALRADPIVYEDFLPRSAAGIFQSNLTSPGSQVSQGTQVRRDQGEGTFRDMAWLSEVIGAEVADPQDLYAAQQATSLSAVGVR